MKSWAIIVVVVVGGFVAVGCSTKFMEGDPERSLSLPNDASSPRLVRRCDSLDDCRSPEKGELVQPGESFEFEIYADQERAYQVANAEGTTIGCVMVYVADGTPNPDSLSDLTPCPPLDPVKSAKNCLTREGFRLNANVPWYMNNPVTLDVELPPDKLSHYQAEMGSFTITVMLISFETERSARTLEGRLAQNIRHAGGTNRATARLISRSVGRVGRTVLTWWPPSPATRARTAVQSCLDAGR